MEPEGSPKESRPALKAALLSVVVLALLCVAIAIVLRKPTATTKTEPSKPLETTATPAKKLPPSDRPQPSHPPYPVDEWTKNPPPQPQSTAIPGKTSIGKRSELPRGTVVSDTIPLSAPPTEVHSLTEAEKVMGPPSPETGQIGVPRVQPLPKESATKVEKIDAASGNRATSAAKAVGAPPGTPPEDVGRTKTQPLPKDRKRP